MTFTHLRLHASNPASEQDRFCFTRRARLVARWRRAADGKLECRWKRAEDQDRR
jgi:hypothetical protein